MRCKGKSDAPELYQTSTLLVPKTQTSRKFDRIDTTPSGEPSALAKSSGSTLVPSSNAVIQIF